MQAQRNLEKKSVPLKTVGIWFGYTFPVSSKREGITRYALYLANGIVENSNLDVEIWCYDINRKGFEELFADLCLTGRLKVFSEKDLVSDLPMRRYWWTCKAAEARRFVMSFLLRAQASQSLVKIRTAMILLQLFKIMMLIKNHPLSWLRLVAIWISVGVLILSPRFGFDTLNVYLVLSFFGMVWMSRSLVRAVLNKAKNLMWTRDILMEVSNKISKAEAFLVPYVGLLNAEGLKVPRVIAVHDLVTIKHVEDFLSSGEHLYGLVARNCRILEGLSAFAQKGDYFVSNSKFVMDSHAKALIPNVKNENCYYVNLPVNIPKVEAHELDIVSKYGIIKRFLFYPTQVRPYKNVELLIDALNILVDHGYDLQLVLTASNASAFPSLLEKIKSADGRVVVTGDVSESDLFNLHKKALVTVAPTKFEGGIPWPALEAFNVGTPVVLCRTPQTVERLLFSGVEIEDSGIPLADPDSASDLAGKIKDVIESRDFIISRQKETAKRIESYSWREAALEYISLFEKITESRRGNFCQLE